MKRVKKFVTHPLFSGSAIVVAGSNITNVLAYVYHLIIGRVLGPAQYGELVSVISIFGLLIASVGFLNIVITKFVSSSQEKDIPKLVKWFEVKSDKYGLIFAFILLVLTPFISNFVKVDKSIILLLPPLVFLSIRKTVYSSSLNGLLRFKQAVIGASSETVLRLIFSVSLVAVGLSVFGAFSGYLLSSIVSLFIFRYYLRDKISSNIGKSFTAPGNVLKYSVPVFLNSLAMMSFFSSDVILVKHFFESSYDVGIYGSLSNMGKIIFYSLSPVSVVMFPMISKKHSKGENYINILFLSSMLVLSGIFVVLFVYRLFPEFAISILFGEKFLSGAPYLFYFGLIMSIFSFDNLIINFYLSKTQIVPAYFSVLASISQIVGIWLYHDSLMSVIYVSLFSVLLLSVLLLIYSLNEFNKARQT